MKASTCIKTGLAALCLLISTNIVLSQPTGSTSSGLNVAKKGIWPAKTCSVCWENPTPANETERQWVRQAIADTWEKFSAFRFTGWGACRRGQKGIRITIDRLAHPHVQDLGAYLDGEENGMVLNFDWKSCNRDRKECITWVAVHEFGHALGFAHEQNRGDAPQACNEEESQGSDGDWYLTPYDDFSVMNYCNPKWNNGGVLSPGDVAGVQKLYGANDFEDRGGTIISEPVACSMMSGRLDAFAVGLDGAAYHQYFENGVWSEWMSLGGDFKFSPLPIMAATSLSTVSWGKNHLDVYGRGTDGAVYQKWWNESKGKWEGWNNLGGNIVGAPVAVSWGPGRIDLFGIGTDGGLFHNYWDVNLNNQKWGGWEPLGGKFKHGTVAVVSQAPGKLDIVGIGMDDAMYHLAWNNGWTEWKPLGGKFVHLPTMATQGDGILNVFCVGADKQLYQKAFYNNKWQDRWEPLGGQCENRPSVVSLGLEHCTVLVRGTDGGLYENRWNHFQKKFDGFKRLGGVFVHSPFAVGEGVNIHVLMRAPKDEMLHLGWRDPHPNPTLVKFRESMDVGSVRVQKRF
ncbi:MAG: hypothetical protein IT258_19975 [Saprospiraceae bacterium]|nr:hypothetical protein [Saprospiraceae bacterium]